MTPEEHAEQKALAEELIAAQRVHTWRELGIAFGISSQAAQMRFGKAYGLVLPTRERAERHMVSVTLDNDLDERLERARVEVGRREYGRRASRAQVVRGILERHLPAV